ncbi:glycosyltransferase family 4 protein [Paenibacillus lemnae]|uniref:Glycosyltransferase family 4 protein n=1 Tax=Paenibacillus lemnae TaxID=1330551 RepID=A0A848M857_PAELE|nr:glycosyltransferase family 4 protein [Paenibacillus lemnae]NMO95714.1 glycosyltransferase family 4 protein [Paenibacillus lemnae]
MKIAFYNHTSDMSGAEISLLLTAKHLKKAHPILFAPEGPLLQKARSQGIEVTALSSFRARMTRNPFMLIGYAMGMLLAGWKLARQLKRSEADLVHANSIRAGIMAGLFRWFHGLPVIWHVRDMPPRGFMGQLIRRFAARSAQAVIGISDSVLYAMEHESLVDKCHLVHNGVELKQADPAERRENREKVRAELETSQDAQVLAIIGQIAPWKRQEDAIEAFSTLVREGRNCVLWIVGEAKFRPENERYLAHLHERVKDLQLHNHVKFTGYREDVLEICCGADLLLLCSEDEPFGRVIIEAMSQGTPVIASRGGGVPEIIEQGRSGWMYETGHIQELTDRIRQVLDDDRLWRSLSHNGQQRAADRFSIQQTAEKVEFIYQQLLNRPGTRAYEHRQAKEMM